MFWEACFFRAMVVRRSRDTTPHRGMQSGSFGETALQYNGGERGFYFAFRCFVLFMAGDDTAIFPPTSAIFAGRNDMDLRFRGSSRSPGSAASLPRALRAADRPWPESAPPARVRSLTPSPVADAKSQEAASGRECLDWFSIKRNRFLTIFGPVYIFKFVALFSFYEFVLTRCFASKNHDNLLCGPAASIRLR